jgi:isohexenylglutaconyl-CoA hydratase
MLTGARFKGEEAVRLGIGHQVASDAADLDAQCDVILGHINACAPGANAVTKGILFESLRRPRAEALDFASQGFAQCMLSSEGLEGIAAFVEKRKPVWAEQSNDQLVGK